MNLDNLLNEAGPLDARTVARLERLAAGVREGHFGRLNTDGRDLWLYRLPGGAWRLTTSALPRSSPVASDGAWGPPLWRSLERGADTPAGRAELAFSMTRLIPCGSCRQHWIEALRGLTAEHCATAEAFSRWVSDRHNDVNLRLGKPLWRPAAEAAGDQS